MVYLLFFFFLEFKGAERKNKDDQKHLEKMCEKMRGK